MTFITFIKDISLVDESERGELKSENIKTQHSENKDHGIWSHHFMANRWETMETVTDFIFGARFATEACAQGASTVEVEPGHFVTCRLLSEKE